MLLRVVVMVCDRNIDAGGFKYFLNGKVDAGSDAKRTQEYGGEYPDQNLSCDLVCGLLFGFCKGRFHARCISFLACSGERSVFGLRPLPGVVQVCLVLGYDWT